MEAAIAQCRNSKCNTRIVEQTKGDEHARGARGGQASLQITTSISEHVGGGPRLNGTRHVLLVSLSGFHYPQTFVFPPLQLIETGNQVLGKEGSLSGEGQLKGNLLTVPQLL
jgi:hypothetical protein